MLKREYMTDKLSIKNKILMPAKLSQKTVKKYVFNYFLFLNKLLTNHYYCCGFFNFTFL